jgi:hypothetical protein
MEDCLYRILEDFVEDSTEAWRRNQINHLRLELGHQIHHLMLELGHQMNHLRLELERRKG